MSIYGKDQILYIEGKGILGKVKQPKPQVYIFKRKWNVFATVGKSEIN